MTLELITSNKSNGIKVDWQQTLGPAQGCGGVLASNKGTIAPPIDPATNEYYPNLFCIWQLNRKGAKMDIIDFDLEPRSNSTGKCSDYLEVIDGEYIHDDVIFGPQCGQLDVFHLRTFDKKVFIVWVIQNQF